MKELGYSSAGVVLESDVEGIVTGRQGCVRRHGVPRRGRGGAQAPRGEDPRSGRRGCSSVSRALRDRAPGCPPGRCGARRERRRDRPRARRADHGAAAEGARLPRDRAGCLDVELRPRTGARLRRLRHERRGREARRSSRSRGALGTDAVILAASTRSNQPVELALEFARPRSTVVVVGAVGMEIPRSPFYEKELVLTISCSYGPGRYDPLYEQAGIDYPVGHVRWTENRNMQASLDLMARGQLDTTALVTHRFPIERATEAYDLITGKTTERYLGILLDFPREAGRGTTARGDPRARRRHRRRRSDRGRVRRSRQLRHVVPASAPRQEERLSRGRRDDATGEREVGRRRSSASRSAPRTPPRSSPTRASTRSSSRRGTTRMRASRPRHCSAATASSSRSRSPSTKDELSAVEAAARQRRR